MIGKVILNNLDIAENASRLNESLNVTEKVEPGLEAFTGNWQLILGALLLIIVSFVIIYLLKNIVVNAIIGIITLLFVRFVLGIPIPLTPLVVLVSVLGGAGGVAALLIAVFFGWL